MKNRVISFYSKIISFLLVLLGFSSCSLIDPKDEYGVPSAKFKVKGQVVDAETENSIGNIKAALGLPSEQDGVKGVYYIDSVYTGKDGKFEVDIRDYPDIRKLVLKIEDSEKEIFETRVDTIDFTGSNFSGGSGNWYEGKAVKDLGKVTISRKEDKK
ncbi:radical SAM-associated putative lipoprotein [Dysgonomonas sp.]